MPVDSKKMSIFLIILLNDVYLRGLYSQAHASLQIDLSETILCPQY